MIKESTDKWLEKYTGLREQGKQLD
jgi:hypothetical protein